MAGHWCWDGKGVVAMEWMEGGGGGREKDYIQSLFARLTACWSSLFACHSPSKCQSVVDRAQLNISFSQKISIFFSKVFSTINDQIDA